MGRKIDNGSWAEDAVLWEEFKTGSHEAFSIIYTTQIQALYKYGMQLIHDTELVEDCIQDLFIYIWDTKERLGKTDNIKYYLFRSLRRRLAHAFQAHNGNRETIDDHNDLHFGSDSAQEDFIIITETQELYKAKLTQSIAYLTKRQREAIYLRFYDNLSFQEIADVMSLSLKATYNLVSKAVDALRQYIHLILLCLLSIVCL
jgi:RNA polymerase sigma factor (sigma-70 family)